MSDPIEEFLNLLDKMPRSGEEIKLIALVRAYREANQKLMRSWEKVGADKAYSYLVAQKAEEKALEIIK